MTYSRLGQLSKGKPFRFLQQSCKSRMPLLLLCQQQQTKAVSLLLKKYNYPSTVYMGITSFNVSEQIVLSRIYRSSQPTSYFQQLSLYSLIFCSVLCDRLSWLFVRFKCTLKFSHGIMPSWLVKITKYRLLWTYQTYTPQIFIKIYLQLFETSHWQCWQRDTNA